MISQSPDKITEMYVRGKIQEYITLCIQDERSATFIKKVQEISLDLFGQPPKKSSNSPSKNFNVPSSAGYK
jgi:hypothetical protein